MTDQKTPLAAAIFATLYPASQGLAQEAAPPVATRLEPVIVTATRRTENLQDVAQSVTALSTEFIEKQALTNLYDLVGALPSRQHRHHLAGPEHHHHPRHRDRLRRIPDRQPGLDLSRRAADDVDHAAGRRAPRSTSRVSRCCPAPRARCSDRARRRERSPTSPTSRTSAASRARFRPRSARPRAAAESYDISGWVNIPVSDNFAMRAVGFWSDEGGYVDNVLGATLMGDATNADIAEDDQEHAIARPVAVSRDSGRSIRTGICSLTGIYPAQRH